MVPPQFRLERPYGEHGKDGQRYHFLYHLELHNVERSAIVAETETVGRYLQTIFEESDAPTESYDTYQRQGGKPTELLFHLQVPISGNGHKDVGTE